MIQPVLAAAAVVAVFSASLEGQTTAFKLRFEDTVLRSRTATSKPTSVRANVAREHAVGDLFISLTSGQAKATRAGHLEWEAKADVDLAWVSAGKHGVYLTSGSNDGSPIPTGKDQIRVLNAQTGKWGSSLTLVREGIPVGGTVTAITETESGLAVSAEVKGGTLVEFFKNQPEGFSPKPEWEVMLAPGTLVPPEDGALLFAARYPDHADPTARGLLAMGTTLIVSCGALEPIRGIDVRTGEVQWTLERPWEFQRGFIGPSVWSHTITRFGKESDFSHHQDGHVDEQARAQFDAAYFGTIIAGPVGSPKQEKVA